MELKKNKKYDLEHKRPMFFGIGMIVSLSLVLLAFEWKSQIEPIVGKEPVLDEPWYVLEEPQITKHRIPELPKPKVEKQVISAVTDIKEVEKLTQALETDTEPIDISTDIPIEFGSKADPKVSDQPFLVVEDMPEFPGGDEALMTFIAKHIRYPKQAQRMGIEGRVFLKFIVDESGKVSNIEIMKGIGAGCDKEAIRVLKLLPSFTPGKQRGVPVKVQMQLPVNFKLQ